MVRLTIVVDPSSPTPAEHRVVAAPGGAIVGSAGDAQVALPGLPGHHVRFEVIDARLVVRALAAGVWVRRASPPEGVAALVPEVARKGDVLDVHQARTLREGDVVRLLPVRDGPAHELRVDVGLLALGGRRAVAPSLAFSMSTSHSFTSCMNSALPRGDFRSSVMLFLLRARLRMDSDTSSACRTPKWIPSGLT